MGKLLEMDRYVHRRATIHSALNTPYPFLERTLDRATFFIHGNDAWNIDFWQKEPPVPLMVETLISTATAKHDPPLAEPYKNCIAAIAQWGDKHRIDWILPTHIAEDSLQTPFGTILEGPSDLPETHIPPVAQWAKLATLQQYDDTWIPQQFALAGFEVDGKPRVLHAIMQPKDESPEEFIDRVATHIPRVNYTSELKSIRFRHPLNGVMIEYIGSPVALTQRYWLGWVSWDGGVAMRNSMFIRVPRHRLSDVFLPIEPSPHEI